MKLRLLLSTLVLALSGTAARAQSPSDCELHIWPTNSFHAVSHGWAPGAGLGGTVSPREEVQRTLSQVAGGDFQRSALEKINLGASGRFAGYRIVFHEPTAEPLYGNWILKDVGAGARNTASTSQCYAELHVIFITYLKTAMSKKIQTAFVFREFDGGQTATRWAADAGSTGAPAFPARSPEQENQARADLQAAFQQNLRNIPEQPKDAAARKGQPLLGAPRPASGPQAD